MQQSNRYKKRPNSNGSVLIMALVIVVVGTVGVLATVSIIGVRSLQAEAEFEGVERRVKHQNSEQLAKQVIYQNYLNQDVALGTPTEFTLSGPFLTDANGDGVPDATVGGIPGHWGYANISPFTVPAFEFAATARTHPTGATSIRAFSQDLTVALGDGQNALPRQFQMRSYNPALAGDLLVFNRIKDTENASPVLIAGDISVEGRAVYFDANYSANTPVNVRAEQTEAPAIGGPDLIYRDPADLITLPSNYPEYPQTNGLVDSGLHYQGELGIVDNVNSINSYFQRVLTTGGQATLRGDIPSTDGAGADTLPSTPADAGLIASINDPNVAETTVVGQLAVSLPLSSDVLFALLSRPIPIADNLLVPILTDPAQVPLPDDIMTVIASPTVLIANELKTEIFNATGYSYVSDGAGNVVVSIGSILLTNLLMQDVTTLTLKGQNSVNEANLAANEQPRVIAVANRENVILTDVNLDGETNERRFVVALSQRGVLDNDTLLDVFGNVSAATDVGTRFNFVNTVPFSEWRMILEMEGISSSWDTTAISEARITGGIRTDHSLSVTGGSLRLLQETETSFFETVLSRSAWIEVYQ